MLHESGGADSRDKYRNRAREPDKPGNENSKHERGTCQRRRECRIRLHRDAAADPVGQSVHREDPTGEREQTAEGRITGRADAQNGSRLRLYSRL